MTLGRMLPKILQVSMDTWERYVYVDLIVSVTNVFVVFLSTINKHFLLLLTLMETCGFVDVI